MYPPNMAVIFIVLLCNTFNQHCLLPNLKSLCDYAKQMSNVKRNIMKACCYVHSGIMDSK